MATASFRITMWRARTPPRSNARRVTAESREEAVFVAQEWVTWSNDAGRGKRDKYGHYRVEEMADDGTWAMVAEGTLADAKTQVSEEESSLPEIGTVRKRYIGLQGTTREFRGRRGARSEMPQSRLAQIVAKVKKET